MDVGKVKILVVDDHALLRRGLIQVLAEDFDQATIIESSTGQEALDLIRNQEMDAIVLDINLPDKNGVEVLKEIKQMYPTLPVLILSLYAEEQYGLRVLKAGASGFLTKESAPEELVTAIKKVLSGGKYVSASFAEHLANDLIDETPNALHEILSDRELEVLCLIARGKKVSQISNELALSVKTVSTYRGRLLEKLRLKTTAELIRYALDHHLVE